MMTVNEVSKLTGVSIRTLQYYDKISLLKPTAHTEVGVRKMDFSAFDTRKIDEYAAQAKQQWGKTEVYKEFEQKSKGRSADDEKVLGTEMLQLFAEFGTMKALATSSDTVQHQVKRLQEFINEHYYTCTNEILFCLGQMYVSGGDMTENIDAVGGIGTAEFVAKAIKYYCGK